MALDTRIEDALDEARGWKALAHQGTLIVKDPPAPSAAPADAKADPLAQLENPLPAPVGHLLRYPRWRTYSRCPQGFCNPGREHF